MSKELKKFYCVTSAFHDSGQVVAAVTMTRQYAEKPDNHFTEGRDRDIYTEWYDNLEDANNAVREARAESSGY